MARDTLGLEAPEEGGRFRSGIELGALVAGAIEVDSAWRSVAFRVAEVGTGIRDPVELDRGLRW